MLGMRTLLLMLMPVAAGAVPVYYTFEGRVARLEGAPAGFGIGAPLRYVFVADRDRPAFYVGTNGDTLFYPAVSGDESLFFADIIHGTVIPRDNEYPGNLYRIGHSRISGQGAMLYASDPDPTSQDFVFVKSGLSLEHWSEGQVGFLSSNYTTWTGVHGELTLVDISTPGTAEAVPEPTAAALAGFGFAALGILGLRRMRRG